MFSYPSRGDLMLEVNGEIRRVHSRPADTLLDTLRQELGLTGAKPGCENGDCGACTVILDGLPVKSCMVLAAEASGRAVTTVEGLHNTALQDAFMDEWAFQCGYCTSGFLCVAHALAEAHPDADRAKMVEWLRSNLCRCTGYAEIQAAVASVLSGQEESPEEKHQ